MKKSGLLLAAAAVAGMLLTGCGASQKSTFSPSVSCVYVAQDGSVSSALVKEYEGDTVNSKDLQQYLEAAVIRFNQENGAQGLAENKMGADKLPASLQSVTADKGVMKAVFDLSLIHICADGNIRWWKRPGRVNICRCMRMSAEPISLIPKTCA